MDGRPDVHLTSLRVQCILKTKANHAKATRDAYHCGLRRQISSEHYFAWLQKSTLGASKD